MLSLINYRFPYSIRILQDMESATKDKFADESSYNVYRVEIAVTLQQVVPVMVLHIQFTCKMYCTYDEASAE